MEVPTSRKQASQMGTSIQWEASVAGGEKPWRKDVNV